MLKRLVAVYVVFNLTAAFGGSFFEDASRLYQNKQFSAVEKRCLNELKENEQSLDAYFFLIAVRLYEAKFKEAIPYMEKFADLHKQLEKERSKEEGAPFLLMDSRYAVLYYELGRYYFKSKKYGEATEWFMHAKSFYYNDPMFNFYIGICHKQTGNYSEAIKYLKRQLEQNPGEPSPLYNIACVYAVAGQKSEAITWLRKGIKAYPKFKDQAMKDADFDLIHNTRYFQKFSKYNILNPVSERRNLRLEDK